MSGASLPEGLHEAIFTKAIERDLARETQLAAELDKVDPADQPHVLARHLGSAIHRHLDSIKDPAKRLAAANQLLAAIPAADEEILEPVQQLTSLRRPPGPAAIVRYEERPRTPLNDAALLTKAHASRRSPRSSERSWGARTRLTCCAPT